MSYRYVTQRDFDSTWSVREVATNNRAVYRGQVLAGLTEAVAALNVRKLNDLSSLDIQLASTADCPLLVTVIQETISSPLPRR
jgi:hypothetical protein